jgi:shikimate kinase
MPGSGKTTIGKLISDKINMKLFSIDDYIQNKEGKTINDIFKFGEDYFRKLESKAVEDISKETGLIIDTGGGVIKNPRNIENLKKNGFIVFINRPIDHILSDIDVLSRPLLKDGKEKLYDLFKERYNIYKNSCDYELMNDSDLEVVLDRLTKAIEH